jgi:hypothetical protein
MDRTGLDRSGMSRTGMNRRLASWPPVLAAAAPGRLSRLRRAGGPAIVLAAFALLAAACGGSAPAAPQDGSKYQELLAFAQCMRSHGEPGFPDATGQGAFRLPASIQTTTARFQSADDACQKLLPHGGTGFSPAGRQSAISKALQFSECMRAHGIPAFPDPVSGGKGVSFPPASGVDPRSPQFQSAQRACQSLLPGGHAAP